MSPRFSRTALLLGEEALQRLRRARVAIVGLGGVGGFCLEALVRTGVEHILVADMDAIGESNFNRQPLALDSTLGRSKVDAAQERARQINPAVEICVLPGFVHRESIPELDRFGPQVVVDAIDSLNPKVELLASCVERGWPVVSSMGAARRLDPTRVRTGLLSEVSGDRLASRIRSVLKKRGHAGVLDRIPVVYSEEPVRQGTQIETAQADAGYHHRGRTRQPMGSICHVVGCFGLVCAHLAIQEILGGGKSSSRQTLSRPRA